MSTDREVLADLLRAVDGLVLSDLGSQQRLRAAANGARRHLLLVESPDGDCRQRIEEHGAASYAAGVAHGRGARPGQRPGATVDP